MDAECGADPTQRHKAEVGYWIQVNRAVSKHEININELE